MHILIFSPHPDDDVIGCGGSIVKHLQSGNTVFIFYMTNGESGSMTIPKEELADRRKNEAVTASGLLRFPSASMSGKARPAIMFLRYPDGALAVDPKIIAQVVTIIRRERPDIVYIPHEKDAHSDHVATHRIVREAINRAAGPWFQECPGDPWFVPTVLCYEVWTPLQDISYVEDITAVMDVKLAALRKHVSQLEGIAYDEAVAGFNRYRGVMTGRGTFCECFQVLRVGRIW